VTGWIAALKNEASKMRGIVGKILDWFSHGAKSDMTTLDWSAFLVVVLIAGLLWTRVVKSILA
jgi:hypothetical protein